MTVTPRRLPKKLEPMPELWERQPGESEEAWQAFQIYRNLGIDRGTDKVAERVQKSRSLMGRWKVRWSWKERALAWDRELDREMRDALVKENVDSVKKLVHFGNNLTSLAVVKLNALIEEQKSKGKIPILSREEMLEYAKLGFQFERLGLGESTSIVEMKGAGNEDDTIIERILNDKKARKLALEIDELLSTGESQSNEPDDASQSEMGEGEASKVP